MEELNSFDPKIIDEVTKTLFVQEILLITINYGVYISGREIREIKIPKKYSYKSFKYQFSKQIDENKEINAINYEKEWKKWIFIYNNFSFTLFLFGQ